MRTMTTVPASVAGSMLPWSAGGTLAPCRSRWRRFNNVSQPSNSVSAIATAPIGNAIAASNGRYKGVGNVDDSFTEKQIDQLLASPEYARHMQRQFDVTAPGRQAAMLGFPFGEVFAGQLIVGVLLGLINHIDNCKRNNKLSVTQTPI